jgi:hypothetical protein
MTKHENHCHDIAQPGGGIIHHAESALPDEDCFPGLRCRTSPPDIVAERFTSAGHASQRSKRNRAGSHIQSKTPPATNTTIDRELHSGMKSATAPEDDCTANTYLPLIPAGWPESLADGCAHLDPVAVLKATPRSFALRVHGQSMVNAGIYDGDIVVGEITPVAHPGAIVVALIDGESTLKRLIRHQGQPMLMSENPNCPDLTPLSELVIQGVVHSVVRRVR